MAVVYTGGTFDLLHKGHLELLEACRRMAGTDGRVIVGLNTDEFIERFKGKKPFQSYEDRKRMLEGCRYVDHVRPNIGKEDSTETIRVMSVANYLHRGENVGIIPMRKVDIVAIGTDWAPPKDYYAQMGFTKEWLDKMGIVLVYVDRRTGESTTAIKERLRDY